jgi:hypothetical protein
MKKFILLLSIIALFCQSTFAQTGGLNFQGIARNASGAVLANQKVNLKFSILKTTETGAVEYTETKEVTTNAQGIFAVVIGEVNATSFAAIDWKVLPKFLKVEMDPAGGTSFVAMGTTRLQNVPYAYYANGVNANNIDGSISIAKGGTGATDAAAARTNLGLGNVDNTADAAKAISTATQAALDLKANAADLAAYRAITVDTTMLATKAAFFASNYAPINSPSFTGTVSGITKGMVGLGLVDNTTDATKPISAATQAALDLKASTSDLNNALTLKANVTALNLKAPIASPTFSGNVEAAGFKIVNGTSTQYLMADGTVSSGGGSSIPNLANSVTGTLPVANGGTGLTSVGTAGQVLSTTGSGTLTWTTVSGGGSGVTVGTISSTSTANGASITAGVLNLAPANASNGGVVTTGTQTFAGAKTFNSDIIVNGLTIGLGAGQTNNQNITMGSNALANNTGGQILLAIGNSALQNNTTANYNIGIGVAAVSANSTGINNVGLGVASLASNNGSNNTAIGRSTLLLASAIDDATSLGYKAGYNNNGSFNTFLGSNTDQITSNSSVTNATAIGYNAKVDASNTIQLGNTSLANVKTSGTITAGDVTYPKAHGTNGQVLSTTGSGTLTWTTTAGLPTSGNTAGEMLYWNGSAWVKVAAGSNGQTLTFYNGAPVWIGTFSNVNTVVSPTGRIWMDRNLGASQVATSSTDAASFGDLYQWGRGPDGHQIRTSATTSTLSPYDQPGVSAFITTGGGDWRSPQNVNLWQGVSGVNNPCPTGFRIPTDTEWEAERLSWGVNSGAGALASPLKLPLAGNRVSTNGVLNMVDSWGQYWSSTVAGTRSRDLFIYSSGATMDSPPRSQGLSVRCIKD